MAEKEKRSDIEAQRDAYVEKLQAIIDRLNSEQLDDENLRRDISTIITAEVRQFAAMRDAQIWEEGAQAGLSVEDKENDALPPNPYRTTF